MYVCVCNAVTESQVKQAVDGGARTLRALQATLDIGLECGRCARYAKGMLKGAAQAAGPLCDKDCGHCPRA